MNKPTTVREAEEAGLIEAPDHTEPHLWPFQKLVEAREVICECDGECRCPASTHPRISKATIYHSYDHMEQWESRAKAARISWQKFLIRQGVPKNLATELSWRCLEEILYEAAAEDGFDEELVAAEIDALIAFGERNPPDPDLSPEAIAATLAEISRLYAQDEPVLHRPTTTIQFLKRLGVWDDAAKMVRAMNGDVYGSLLDVWPSAAWRFLSFLLRYHQTVEEIRTGIRDCFGRQMETEAGRTRFGSSADAS